MPNRSPSSSILSLLVVGLACLTVTASARSAGMAAALSH